MNRAITFFGRIFQSFRKPVHRAPTSSSSCCLCLRPKTVVDFVQLRRARLTTFLTTLVACWFFHHPIHNKSNETA
ncbi:hypothetical protein ZWY2020_011263 [Hordeum vulgare]|nr:hypothetical protein ZWY2020_011263 [Hordeum vulgare]